MIDEQEFREPGPAIFRWVIAMVAIDAAAAYGIVKWLFT